MRATGRAHSRSDQEEVEALMIAEHPEWSGREWIGKGVGCLCAEHPA
ncbi:MULTISPECIES: hypothetical protein [Saccharothrix]|nr:hypothetical protein [Saccharothrix sp. CB00851]